jgi:hypothetical protein
MKTNCPSWSFNKVDVPCCIQRTSAQWNNENYDTSTMLSYADQKTCDDAAQKQYCNFKGLFTRPSTSNNDYYKSFLENNFTSGCESLRSNGTWGSITQPGETTQKTCGNDLSPNDCYSGNCGVNYCAPWSSYVDNPFKFQQNVTCLPTASCCTNPTKLVVTNGGLPSVSGACQ